MRPTVAEIDLAALRANVTMLAGRASGALLMAVVKADAYGHGAVPIAKAALDAGASWLAIALVEEGLELRAAGIDSPVFVLSEPPLAAAGAVIEARLTPVVYRESWIEALAEAARSAGRDEPVGVHLKVDTGMHRAGCDREDALRVAKAVTATGVLSLEGLMTHFAVADEPEHPATEAQIALFESVRTELRDAGFDPPLVHAANSAATIVKPEAHFDLVRCGIALYGIPPAPALAGEIDLQPVMTLRTAVAQVRRVESGERLSYGLRYGVERPSNIAILSIGYADGVQRRLGQVGGEVLIGGRRFPVAGTVTMDQLLVDCGDHPVQPGDEVILIGRQGDEEVTATEWAELLGTVGYEITCGIGARVPRRYTGA